MCSTTARRKRPALSLSILRWIRRTNTPSFSAATIRLSPSKTTANNGKILLIFKDSYANSFVPFLIPYYQQIVMIDPRYYYDDVEQLMTQRGVTDVLFLYNLSTFSADTALADTLGAAS